MSKSPRPLASAVALHYNGKDAPRVSAKGKGLVAETIIELAKQHRIPLHEDPDLLALLSRLELGDEIPRSLYVAVAEVLSFAYMMSGKACGGEAKEPA